MTKQTKHRLGAPPIKMKDLADLAGVSISTVSRSLTNHHSIPEATRQAIQELAAKHGYVVNNSARSLRQKQTRTIALALPLAHEQNQLISDPFFLRLFGSLADEITKRGFDVLLVREPSPDASWLEQLIRSRRADGYIVIGNEFCGNRRARRDFAILACISIVGNNSGYVGGRRPSKGVED